MKCTLLAILIAGTVLGGQAVAADLPPAPAPRAPAIYAPPPPPVFTWTGFYIGGNAGYGWGSADVTSTLTGNSIIPGGFSSTGSVDANGFVGGGQIGVNWQVQQIVFGIEGDWQWANQKTNGTTIATICAPAAPCTFTENGELSWFATARGRLGVAWDRVLVYGTGGAAWVNLQHNLTNTITATGATSTLFNSSTTALGWAAGGGVEVALAQNWTARLEYLYLQANATITGSAPLIGGGAITDSIKFTDNILRGAINFKF